MLSQIESLINAIAVGPARQERLLILGEPAIERHFYSYLGELGAVYYQGNVPTITTSARRTRHLFAKFARRQPGTEAFHVATLNLKRNGGGLIGKIRAGIRNHLPSFLSGRHRLHIMVAGSREVVKARLAELGRFLTDLEQAGYFDLDKARRRHGSAIVGPGKTLNLDGAKTLLDLVWYVRRKPAYAASSLPSGTAVAYRSAAPTDEDATCGFHSQPLINPASGLMMVEGTKSTLPEIPSASTRHTAGLSAASPIQRPAASWLRTRPTTAPATRS